MSDNLNKTDKQNELKRLILLATKKGVLSKLTFSRPVLRELPKKISGVLSLKNASSVALATEQSFIDGKVKHSTISLEQLEDFLDLHIQHYAQINVLNGKTGLECRSNAKGSTVLLGLKPFLASLEEKNGQAGVTPLAPKWERKKNYLLDGDEPFLKLLEISDASGRIHDKKQAKFRQINRFLEHIRDITPNLPSTGKLVIYDLCCGKSYLSFAVYHYFVHILGREIDMLCIDLKPDVIDYCSRIAKTLNYTGMRFICDDVRRTPKDNPPHLVLSLHACDIATDIVLHFAVSCKAGVILSTPCCHHHLREHLLPEAFPMVTKYGHLRSKFCESLTDALRLARLATFGYAVDALELTDPDDTPKNTLLRAIRKKTSKEQLEKKKNDYLTLLQSLLGEGVRDYPEDIV